MRRNFLQKTEVLINPLRIRFDNAEEGWEHAKRHFGYGDESHKAFIQNEYREASHALRDAEHTAYANAIFGGLV